MPIASTLTATNMLVEAGIYNFALLRLVRHLLTTCAKWPIRHLSQGRRRLPVPLAYSITYHQHRGEYYAVKEAKRLSQQCCPSLCRFSGKSGLGFRTFAKTVSIMKIIEGVAQ
jgi:hypothetical protein